MMAHIIGFLCNAFGCDYVTRRERRALEVLRDIRRYRVLYTRHPRFRLTVHQIRSVLDEPVQEEHS